MDRVKLHLRAFGEITGLQVNWQKSEIAVLNYNKEEKE